MGKINVLSSKIYNRIAAGEVVERPASVVKELVENSLDAGAKNIRVEIINGGISSIKITDDGCGIEKDDLKKALLPHATSKISKLNDLDNICSLGFRGEALASIASVAKVTIVSMTKEQNYGAKIYSEGGETKEVEDSASMVGTEITVDNLFFNTPVREKFLKTPRSEESEITNIMSKFILGNYGIAFTYVADGKVVYQSFGDGFESAMSCVYGPEVVNNCYFIKTEKNGLEICGYIGKHYFTKGNRSYQTVFVNGRLVQDITISSAISNAYSSYLMKRQYPFYVLTIGVPTEIVDVNVHPNKLEVRFSNNQIIYGSIYSVVSKVLDGRGEAVNIVVENNEKHQENTNKIIKEYATHNAVEYKSEQPKEKLVFNKVVLNDSGARSINFNEKIIEKQQPVVDIFAENKAFLEKLAKEKEENQRLLQQRVCLDKQINFIGQALNTFLFFDDGVDIYVADQHAAHERILFDKFNESILSQDIIKQPLLIPYILTVNSLEFEFIMQKKQMFNSFGLEIEEFGGNAFKISTVPAFLSEMNLQRFFDDVLSDISSLKNIALNDLMLEKIAQKACKAAVKSGDKLSEDEIKIILDKLKENIGLKCPHGRPVAIKISRTEIDKWFKRIV